ncbi:hypothetical protein BBP40_007319 [Aspergillus hancockii]|nr:hypothetical protein BBP40_007319 [Aspergillus hancockii]
MSVNGAKVPGTFETFFKILREQGIRGMNKGVNAVALRQITGLSSRIGIARFTEEHSGVNDWGALSCWNQPFEVLRVEMQFTKEEPGRSFRPTMISTRGVVPRVGVAGWATVCMVGLGDMMKDI